MSENPEYHQRINCLKHQVDRLRQREQTIAKALGVCDGGEYVNDIVAAVERLQAANAGLRTALEPFAFTDASVSPDLPDDMEIEEGVTVADVRRARKALTAIESGVK